MAIPVSAGYDGSILETQWAALAASLGTPYAVQDAADWKVSIVAGLDRTVRVAAGVGYGHGVRDVADTATDLQLPVIASGTRWDLIAARRDWQPAAGTTVFTVVTGTSAQAIPAGRLTSPGVQDDQLLALVQVTAGQTVPTAVMDLRELPSKIRNVPTLLALPNAPVGTVARVNGRLIYREFNAAGALSWLSGDVVPAWESGGSLGQGVTSGPATGMRVAVFDLADDLAGRSTAGAPASVTIATGGRYAVSMSTRITAGGGAGERTCFLTINRPGDPTEVRIPGSSFDSSRSGVLAASGIVRLFPGDNVRPFVVQTSGATLALSDGSGLRETHFTGSLLAR